MNPATYLTSVQLWYNDLQSLIERSHRMQLDLYHRNHINAYEHDLHARETWKKALEAAATQWLKKHFPNYPPYEFTRLLQAVANPDHWELLDAYVHITRRIGRRGNQRSLDHIMQQAQAMISRYAHQFRLKDHALRLSIYNAFNIEHEEEFRLRVQYLAAFLDHVCGQKTNLLQEMQAAINQRQHHRKVKTSQACHPIRAFRFYKQGHLLDLWFASEAERETVAEVLHPTQTAEHHWNENSWIGENSLAKTNYQRCYLCKATRRAPYRTIAWLTLNQNPAYQQSRKHKRPYQNQGDYAKRRQRGNQWDL